MSITNLLTAGAANNAMANSIDSRIARGEVIVLNQSAGEKLKVENSVSSKIAFRKDKEGNKLFEENAIVFYPAFPDVQEIVDKLGAELLTKIVNDLVISKADEIVRDVITEAKSFDVEIKGIFDSVIDGIKSDYSGASGRKSSLPTADELEDIFANSFAKPLAVVAASKGITDNVKLANLLAVYMNLFKDLFSRKGSNLSAQANEQLIKMTQLDNVPAEAQVMILERIQAIAEAKAKKEAKSFDLL